MPQFVPPRSQTPTGSTTSNIGGNYPFVAPPHRPHLFALIIGINKYKSAPDIPNLVGAVADADAMENYLRKYLGVPRSQIRNLRDGEATRDAIIKEIEAFSKDEGINEGDPILIYYAGHGSSAKTPNGWVGSTGKIELLIPHDHSPPLDDSNPTHGIPDRTLEALLSDLARKKGDNITVILDCCHSSSATRGDFKPRAIDVENVQVPSDLDQDIWSDIESSMDVERGATVKSGFARKGLRSHVLLAACQSQESAYERTSSQRGVFTLALLDTLIAIGIDKLTYATLFDLRMPTFPASIRQNPQCEGFNKNRIIFNGKAPGKRTIYYKIRKSEGETYVMPDGEAAGITVGAEFEVYQDLYSDHLLGTVVASELSPFSTTLQSKEKGSGFALDQDGVAFKSCPGIKEQVLIHVADEVLKDLVRKIDSNQRIIQLVERDCGAEFGIALENEKVVFNIYDSDLTKHGLTRMPFILEPTFEALSPVIRAAAHFYWHRRRAPQTDHGLAKFVEVKPTKVKKESVGRDGRLNELFVYCPTDWDSGKESPQTEYGWEITNKCKVPLYPALFYFDNSDWSITPYYEPPIALGTVEPPLKDERSLTVGYGDSGSVPYTYFLREGQNVDVGTLKLFLSRNQVNLSHVAQPSPFQTSTTLDSLPVCTIQVESMINLSQLAQSSDSSPSHHDSHVVSTPTTGLDSRGSRRVTEVPASLSEHTDLPLPWDTIEISLIQQLPDK